jgi:hypothetical protein
MAGGSTIVGTLEVVEMLLREYFRFDDGILH